MDTNPSQLRSTHAHSSSSPLPKSELSKMSLWTLCVTPFRRELKIHVKEFFREEDTLGRLITSLYTGITSL